jgi:hypothetical protein
METQERHIETVSRDGRGSKWNHRHSRSRLVRVIKLFLVVMEVMELTTNAAI